jgi:hypothetical protein
LSVCLEVIVKARDYVMNQMERGNLVHYLRVAATGFDDAARTENPFRDRLLQQAADARALADRLEAASYVHVGAEVAR